MDSEKNCYDYMKFYKKNIFVSGICSYVTENM